MTKMTNYVIFDFYILAHQNKWLNLYYTPLYFYIFQFLFKDFILTFLGF